MAKTASIEEMTDAEIEAMQRGDVIGIPTDFLSKEARVGQSVLVYESGRGGLFNPVAGLIVAVGDDPSKCDLHTYHNGVTTHPPVMPARGATYCATDKELEQAMARGVRWACKPSNPANPQKYVAPKAKAAPKVR